MTELAAQQPDLNDDVFSMGLCVDCAKHPSLKAFVEATAIEGPICGVCRFTDLPYRVSDPAQNDALTNLVKALIRFYFSEHAYNGHWGGDSEPEGLLAQSNPIIETESHLFRTREPEAIEEYFNGLLAAQPYPSRSEGVWLYAGFDAESGRNLQFAISERDSPVLSDLRSRLETTNPFHLEPEIDELLGRIGPRIDRHIEIGQRFFRARIGVRQSYHHLGEALFDSEVRREPFQKGQLAAPPPLAARAGRLNRAGFSFLYLASDPLTAAAEVRPHPGHYLSIGAFESRERLRIASFDQDIAAFAQSDEDLDLYHFLHSADLTMATPVAPEAASRYSTTQLIADCLRRNGFDGVAFRSSLSDGVNLCVFQPESFAYVEGSAVVKKVERLAYQLADAAMTLEPNSEDMPFPE